MQQFDVYLNPHIRLRQAYPLVMVIQQSRVEYADRVVLAPLRLADGPGSRVAPILSAIEVPYRVDIKRLTVVDFRSLDGEALDNLAAHSNEITRVLDHLFNAAG